MKALVFNKDSLLEISKIPIPEPGDGEVLIKLHSAALNRRDYWITKGLYPKITLPAILGSDGSGIVVKLGNGVEEKWLNSAVIINPSLNWGNNENVAAADYSILGMPKPGTFAEYIVVPVDRVHIKPEHLSFEQAAALPLAGLTAYRAVMVKGGVKRGDSVLVSSIGSGVSQFAAQFAALAGAKVWVTSSSDEKISQAKQFINIQGGINYKNKSWKKDFISKAGKVDVIIDGSGGENASVMIYELLKSGGKFVTYGATAGFPPQFPIHSVFLQHKTILGSTMGSDSDFQNMLKFVNTHKLIPIIGKHSPFSQITNLLQDLSTDSSFGKYVISYDQKDSKL
jgi:NADPH:quinone reductase-like Zn-dependent oxidoreductase